jgi:hypothetical protein
LIWPASEALETEADSQRGKIFHRLIELHSKGHAVEPYLQAVEPVMQSWWQTFLASSHAHPKGRILSELPLWTVIQGMKLTARLDRLLIAAGKFHIVDWKTQRHRPCHDQLVQSWQTRLYPLLLCLAGAHLNQGQAISPESIRFTVWYVQHADQPYRLVYSRDRFEQDLQALTDQLLQLQTLQQQHFPMTPQVQTCSHCLFRTRCYGLVPDFIDPQHLELFEWFDAMTAPLDPGG